MAAGLTPGSWPRWLAATGLVLAVVVGHGVVGDGLARHLAAMATAEAMPPRLQVVYVREMTLEPPRMRAAPVPAKTRRPARALRPQPAASTAAVAPEETVAQVVAPPATPEPMPVANAPVASAPVASAPAASASAPTPAASQAGPAFEWPVSTRMRYALTGDFRGEVHGDAQVEWIRAGSRYQVHLDVSVGLLASRRMSSEGDITPQGLAPQRYDQETRLPFDEPYRHTVHFDGERVWLSTGQTLPRWPGVQDTVSQFVQLAWLFDSQPQRLRVGATVEVPLAMPRNVSVWVYDVVGEETLYTPFGDVQAFHLKPRREPRAGGDMTVDIWIAPQLRHLPIRFRIRPDPEAYFDLMLDRRPELAATPQLASEPPAAR